MDLALRYQPATDTYDLSIDEVRGDLAPEDTLTTAVYLSLMCDRLAQHRDVRRGEDRRGWWADAYADGYAEGRDRFGSRLWLLAREKELPATLQRARTYVQEALQWLLDDGQADDLQVSVFVPSRGWLAVLVTIAVDGDSRRYRFEWNDAAQVWRLAGEGA